MTARRDSQDRGGTWPGLKGYPSGSRRFVPYGLRPSLRAGKGMPKLPKLHIGRRRPSLQVLVPILAAGLVVATAFAVSSTVASQQQQTGIDEAVRAVGAVVHGYIDPLLENASLAGPGGPTPAAPVKRPPGEPPGRGG